MTFFSAAALGIAGWMPGVGARPDEQPAVNWAEVRSAVRAVVGDGRIVLTSLAQAAQFVLHGMISAFLPIYAVEQVGLTPAEVGVLFGAQMVTTIVARPLFGRLSDRVGRRPMIVTGLVICSIAVALLTISNGFVPLLLCSAIYGAGLAITTSSTAALITDLSARSRSAPRMDSSALSSTSATRLVRSPAAWSPADSVMSRCSTRPHSSPLASLSSSTPDHGAGGYEGGGTLRRVDRAEQAEPCGFAQAARGEGLFEKAQSLLRAPHDLSKSMSLEAGLVEHFDGAVALSRILSASSRPFISGIE